MITIMKRISRRLWVTSYQLEESRDEARKHRRYFRWWLLSGILILMGGVP